MPKTYIEITIPNEDPRLLELEPGEFIHLEAKPPADEEPEEEPEEAEEDGRAASLWSKVRGFDALPEHKRDALTSLGHMRRGAVLYPKSRALPDGFERMQDDSFIFLLSDTGVGRDGFILAGPWDLDEYRANPVVLYQHNSTWDTPAAKPEDLLPVGRCIQVAEPREGLLISEVVFDTESERGRNLHRLYEQGFLNAVSARWVPQSIAPAWKLDESDPYYHADEDTYVMHGNLLLEQSAVVIPGYAGATLIEGPINSERALDAARSHLADPEFRASLEAAILATPVPVEEPAAADPKPDPAGWWGAINTPKE